MTDPKHTHYSPYGPPRSEPGTLLDCDNAKAHSPEGSEIFADYMYRPRFGPHSASGLPDDQLWRLLAAYTERRSKDISFRITDVTADPEYTYRARITNRTMYTGDGPDWHTEHWGLYPDGEWHGIIKNPHPPYEHMPFFCANCGY